MSEYEVQFALKTVTVSADTPAEAVTQASARVAADLGANTNWVQATKVDRITVTGLSQPPHVSE